MTTHEDVQRDERTVAVENVSYRWAFVGSDNTRVVGHVDAAALKSGTIIRVPLRRAEP